MSNFDQVADTYKKDSITQAKASIKALALLKSVLPSYGSVLDAGCGTGGITKDIAKLTSGKVIGIDISEKMVAYARAHNRADNLEFEVMALDDISFGTKFDCVFANSSFYYIKNRIKCYKKINQTLKQEGSLVVQVSYREKFSKQFMQALNRVLEANPAINEIYKLFENPVYFYKDEADFALELEDSGFNIKYLETEEQVTTLPLDQIMAQYESNVFPNLLNHDNYLEKVENFS